MPRFVVLLLLSLALSLAALACSSDEDSGEPESDYPAAGEDVFDNTTATVEIEYSMDSVSAAPRGGELETIELQGPARVTRSDPADQDGDGLIEIKTEVVEMELRGTASFGEVIVREREDKESVGLVEQQEEGQDFPADSYFEMFVQVELPSFNAYEYRNGELSQVNGQPTTVLAVTEGPLRMEATLSALPPGEGDEYRAADGEPVPLVAVNDASLRLGSIVDALHIPVPEGSGGGGGGESGEPTEEPGGGAPEGPAEVDQALGCEHTQPGVQSDLVDLIFAFLVADASSSDSGGRREYVLQLVSGDGQVLAGPASAQEREPLAGVTINAKAFGAGAITPDQSGVTDEAGAVKLRFPINQFGAYEVQVVSVVAPNGEAYEIGPNSETSAFYTVGQVCEAPPGL